MKRMNFPARKEQRRDEADARNGQYARICASDPHHRTRTRMGRIRKMISEDKHLADAFQNGNLLPSFQFHGDKLVDVDTVPDTIDVTALGDRYRRVVRIN